MSAGFQGGEGGFRSCVKTALTLIAAAGHEGGPDVLRAAWRYVSGDSREECGVSIAFSAAPAPVDGDSIGLGAVSHRVAVRSSPVHDRLEADVRYFGNMGVCIRADAPGVHAFSLGYGVDPLTGTSQRFDDWSGAVGIPGAADHDEVVLVLTNAALATVRFGEKRNEERLRQELIEDAMGEAFADVLEGAPIPEAAVANLARIVAERFAGRLFRIDSSRPAPELLAQLVPKGGDRRS